MKAIVVEIKGKFVAALCDDGGVTQLKNQNYALGQQLELEKITVKKPKLLGRIAAMAACFTLICGLGLGAYAYKTPASYVSMDVNPSVEFTLNIFERVLSARAVNDDGEALLREIKLETLNNKTIDQAISLTLEEISKEGYFAGEGGIVIAASGKKPASAEKLAAHLLELVSLRCAESNSHISVEALAISREQLDEAKALGVTPGKLILVQKLMAENPKAGETSLEEWLKKPVKEIMAERNDLREDAKDAAADKAEDEAEKKQEALDEAREALEEAEEKAAEAG
ncbi:MAG: hypothetical protein RR372_06635, partial [Oscillospiraceae bacterium]